MIPLSEPLLKGNELKYIKDVLESCQLVNGVYSKELEKAISEYIGCKVVLCNSGTSALHISLLLMGIGQGDKVIVPTLTFISSVNAIKYVGAEPVFMDCDNTGNMDVDKLEEYLNDHKVKAIMPVHLFGGACDIKRIMEVAKKHDLIVVEDSAQSLGAFYRIGGEYVGTNGHIGVYSFNINKIVTTGGGGAIVCNNKELLDKARYLINQAKGEGYTHDEIGYNYRMSEVHCAIGLAQMEKIESFINNRKRNYLQYKYRLDKISGIKMLEYPEYVEPNFWFFNLIVEKGRDKLMSYLEGKDIQTRPLWSLCHTQEPYKDCEAFNIDMAYKMQEKALSLPCGNGLTAENEIEETILAIEGYYK